MNPAARPWRTENWADFLPSTLGYSAAPVDLHAVARHRRIKHLGLRFMIPRGMLVPVEGGFEVYLRDHDRKDVDISKSEPDGELTARQRFSLAHEIAHTLFYKFSSETPAPEPISNDLELEKTCDRMAGHILIPTDLLKRDIGDYERIDARFVQWVARTYRTSLTVAISRLTLVEPSNPFERCILLVHRSQGDGHIRAAYFGVGLYRTLPRPIPYARLTEWIADFPVGFIEGKGSSDWKTTRKGRALEFEKTELGSGSDFLLQVQVLPSNPAGVKAA